MKFVASQLHGAPVVAWVEILSSSVEPITFMVDDRARRSEQFIFNKEVYETLRPLLQITDGQWEPPSSQEMYEDTIVGVCDLSAPTFTQSIVHRGKDLQAEYLLREQLQYFPFFSHISTRIERNFFGRAKHHRIERNFRAGKAPSI